jgi:3-oxoadipate enol-lactonase
MPLADVNGVSLYYEIAGGTPDSPMVLFSNSLGTTLEMWDAQVPALVPQVRMLRYDTRGHGRSSVGQGPPTLATLADDVAGLMDALAIPSAHVVGLSLGGATAQQLAMAHPDRVQSLALMATAPFFPPRENWDARIATVRSEGLGALVDSVLERWFTPEFGRERPEGLADQRRRFAAGNPEGYVACCMALREGDLRPGLTGIRAPTLVVAGAEDPVTTPETGRQLAAAIPGARFVMVERARHILAVERADAVNAILAQWLAEQGALSTVT